MADQITMVLSSRFSDGSGTTRTFVGYRNELGEAFGHFLPDALEITRGAQVTVQLYPAPKVATAPRA